MGIAEIVGAAIAGVEGLIETIITIAKSGGMDEAALRAAIAAEMRASADSMEIVVRVVESDIAAAEATNKEKP